MAEIKSDDLHNMNRTVYVISTQQMQPLFFLFSLLHLEGICTMCLLFFSAKKYALKFQRTFSESCNPINCSVDVLDSPQEVKMVLNQWKQICNNSALTLRKFLKLQLHILGSLLLPWGVSKAVKRNIRRIINMLATVHLEYSHRD